MKIRCTYLPREMYISFSRYIHIFFKRCTYLFREMYTSIFRAKLPVRFTAKKKGGRCLPKSELWKTLKEESNKYVSFCTQVYYSGSEPESSPVPVKPKEPCTRFPRVAVILQRVMMAEPESSVSILFPRSVISSVTDAPTCNMFCNCDTSPTSQLQLTLHSFMPVR